MSSANPDVVRRGTSRGKAVTNFDRQLWRCFWSIARPYWSSNEKWLARALLVLLLGLLIGETEFAVLFNYQSGEFTSALAAKDTARYWHSVRVFLALLLVAVPIYGFYYYVRDTLVIHWRRWLTSHFLNQYFARRAFYELTTVSDIDNPDQRIAEDINTFTQKSLSFVMIGASATLQLLAFSRVLWSISPTLVLFLIVYAAVGTLTTFVAFGKPLIGLNAEQLRKEADFRFSLVRVRENAEAIAFYGGERQESANVERRFAALFANFKRLIGLTRNLNLFQYGYGFLTLIVPSVIVAPRVLSGELEVGQVVEAAGAFAAILASLTVFVDNFESLSRFAAGVQRLDRFERAVLEPDAAHGEGPRIERALGPELRIEHLTLQTPRRERTLVRDLTLAMKPAQSLLIVGESGCGKSSLLRAIAGLWSSGAGLIVHPHASEMLFLPQHAYLPLTDLRGQLLYPSCQRELADEELYRVLEQVNLSDVARRFGGLDAELDFNKVLSLGEQQRLAFARVLLHRPRYAILDEATSALDAENEAALYRLLADAGTTLISVSHRPTLFACHQQVLELGGGGTWRLAPATNRESPASILGDAEPVGRRRSHHS